MSDLANKALAKQILIGNCTVEQFLSTLRYARLDQFDTLEEAKDFIKSQGTHGRLVTKDEPLTWIQFDKTNTGWVERRFVCHCDSTYDDGEFIDGDVMINTSFSRQSNFLWVYDSLNVDDVKDTHWIPVLKVDVEKGDSAYNAALKNGFTGSEAEWLASLRGAPFTYDDFTEEQLKALRDGLQFKYEHFTEEQLALLKGDKGDKGDTFEYEDMTADQLSDLTSRISSVVCEKFEEDGFKVSPEMIEDVARKITKEEIVNTLYPVGAVYLQPEGTQEPGVKFKGTVWNLEGTMSIG